MKTPLYYKIKDVQGADVSGVTATAGDVDAGKIFVNSSGVEVEGSSTYKSDYTALHSLVTQTTATDSDVDYGKTYVKSDGTQGTGSSTYKSDYTSLHTLVTQTTATDSDVASGKLYVKSDGTQGTGTASGGNNDEFIKALERNTNTTLTVPNGTTKLGIDVFQNFTGLIAINLPNTLIEIKDRAFQWCDHLTGTVTLPASLITLGNYAFDHAKPTTIIFLGTPTTISTTAFANTNISSIKVPWQPGAVSGAPWGSNASITYGYTPT